MTPVFANRPLRLQRIARLGAMLRACVWLLALSLVLGGHVAATMPLHGMAAADVHAVERGDCGHQESLVDSKGQGHASGDCCRTTCACALGHAIGEVPALVCRGAMRAVASLPPAHEAGVDSARAAPPLRPPIA